MAVTWCGPTSDEVRMTPEFAAPNDDARPIWLVQKDLHDNLPPPMQTWVKVTGFSGKAGQICLLPKSDGSIGER